MGIEIIHIEGVQIAEVKSKDVLITETQDALDLMANCSYPGSGKIMLHVNNLAIVGDFSRCGVPIGHDNL